MSNSALSTTTMMNTTTSTSAPATTSCLSSGNPLPTHIQVQQLNSRGAYRMIHGEYDMAIDDLIQALKLWETIDVQKSDNDNEVDSNCSIDDCILQQQQQSVPSSQNQASLFPLHHKEHAQDNRINSQSSSYDSSSPSSRCEQQHEEESGQRFVYSRPIFTTPQFWRLDCKPRSNTLSLILILNLAMAHHLSALHDKCVVNRSLLQKALQLYELAHQLQLDELACSPMATMIVANNVGEIHYNVNNYEKHTMCMNHLLSTMMFLVDNGQAPTTSTFQEWDGFLRNISQLILKQNCAPVA